MSFVFAAPDLLNDAAGNVSGIGTTLAEATAAAAGPTTNVAAAAADEVSVAFSQLFGTYGQQFQAVSAQAAAYHTEFASLMNGGAAAYLTAELAAAAAATDPILGGLGPIIIGGSNPITGGSPLGPIFAGAGNEIGTVVSALIGGDQATLTRGWYAAGATAAAAAEPYQALFANTVANLRTIVGDWTAHPLPILQQLGANQNGYANTVGAGFTRVVQDFPTTLINDIQIGYHGATTFDYAGTLHTFQARQSYNSAITTAALQNAVVALQERLPLFQADLGNIGYSVLAGDYHGAVHGIPRAFLNLLLGEINISNLSTVNIEGPAGALMPLMSTSNGMQDIVNLITPGIQRQVAQNFIDAFSTSISSVGLAAIGAPISTLDGLATGATAFGAALQTGNGVAALGALVDMPAFALNGLLNGNTVVDLTIQVTETLDFPGIPPLLPPFTVGTGTPVVLHMPFTGLLTPAQPLAVTVQAPSGVTTVPLTFTLGESFGGIRVAGAIPTLLNYLPQQIALAIAN